jgi:hypothetical protein
MRKGTQVGPINYTRKPSGTLVPIQLNSSHNHLLVVDECHALYQNDIAVLKFLKIRTQETINNIMNDLFMNILKSLVKIQSARGAYLTLVFRQFESKLR